jgi:nucleotide-binding universal stress UspA family protein
MRVLIATDGSSDAAKAVRWVRDVPLPPGSVIRVLNVVTFPPSTLDIAPVRAVYQHLREAGRQVTVEAGAILGAGGGTVELRTRQGTPSVEIVREASRWPADLVVVGARGLGAVNRFLMGSVSTAVAHSVSCPIAVARGTATELRRVVIACDGSPDSMAALEFVGQLPLGSEVSVRLLAVMTPPSVPAAAPELLGAGWPPALAEALDAERARLEEVLARAEGQLRGVGKIERSVVAGHPAVEVLRAAEEPGVDLVVVGARGLGTLARLVLGSVSERVLHHAPGPVLIVKRRRERARRAAGPSPAPAAH